MPRIIQQLNAINRTLGKTLAWLSLGMVLLMALTVLQRYLFQSSTIWQQELIRYMHGLVFLGCAGFTLLCNEHVRVDVFYQQASKRYKHWVNLVGTWLFLIPTAIAMIYFSYDFVMHSWAIYEPSSEPLGLPGVFLYKTLLWVCPMSLIIQAVSLTIEHGYALKQQASLSQTEEQSL